MREEIIGHAKKNNLNRNGESMKKRNLDQIQLARAFAIIAVLVVHTSSEGVTRLSPDSALYPFYNFFNIAGKLGTPTFIMLSSFILFYNYFNRELTMDLIKSFYKKRLKFILIPYFVFSLLYFGLTWHLYYDFPTAASAAENFLWKLSLGKAYPHLYFVFISVQLYILFPLLILLFKKSGFLRKNAFWLGLLIQWAWVYINREYLQVPYKGSISLSYMSFYFIGAYLGIHYEAIIEKMKSKSFRTALFSGLFSGYAVMLVMYTGYMYIQRTGKFTSLLDPLPSWITANLAEFTWATHALFAGLVLFFLAHLFNERFSVKTRAVFMEIGATSFGIYLVHPMLLILFRDLFPNGSPIVFTLWQIATFFGIATISWAIVRLAYKAVPAYWILFGKLSPFFQLPKKEKTRLFSSYRDDSTLAYSHYPNKRKND
ncbi:acyltransferase [Bacillus infantis]|uniref:acyltransferase n=1 Tax=Bacillus infantis TaxID=324767 RepID=UPI002E8C4E5C|nr:acyltransferase [Bacillus infantis]